MITEKELRILSYLRNNARASVSGISADIELHPGTVFNRLERLERGVIRRYTSLLDFSSIGFNVKVNFCIRLSDMKDPDKRKSEREKVTQFLLRHQNVNSASFTANGFDFYAETIFKDIKGLYGFIDEISQFDIAKLEEHHVIEDIKREGFLVFKGQDQEIEYPDHISDS